jgi:purine-binding chemotaxis protein CheW
MARRGTSSKRTSRRPPEEIAGASEMRPIAPPSPPPAVIEQLLTFYIGRDEYGISILRVREIAEYRPLTPVPMTRTWMRGVMNLRGTVVPVVDLGARLGLEQTRVSRRTCLVIVELELEGEEVVIAVMVDGVSRVVDVPREDVQEAPPFGLNVDFVPGLVRMDGAMIILLDLRAVLAGEQLLNAAALSLALRDEAAEEAHARQ